MKGIILSSLFIIVSMLMISFVLAGTVYYLMDNVQGIATNVGKINLTKGDAIGGSPEKYVILTETTVLETNAGNITFINGTLIDCDVPPGHPDPCDPY